MILKYTITMRTNLIKKKETPKVEAPKVDEKSVDGMLDMVIAFDTTGSMSYYIKAVKRHVMELIPKLFAANPKLKISIVAFGDYFDMDSKNDFSKAYQVIDLTDNENKLIKFVERARNTCGGDGPEFYELVIKKIVEETSWREGSTKSVLLIADSLPHELGYSYSNIIRNNQIDWRKEARKAATKGIKIDTMQCSDYSWYKELSKITMAIAYKEALEFIQNNPVKDYIEGEDRILRGYKMQFVSRDGKYRCMDMDITRTDKETGERLVNINTISQLIYNGTKYIVV